MIDYDRFLSRAAAVMQESAIRKMGALGLRVPDLISFAPGFPAPDVFAWSEFQDIARSVLDGADPTVLQYGPTRGYRPLVEALPQILDERGVAAVPDELIVTTGSQQALDLTARVFINPGDAVLSSFRPTPAPSLRSATRRRRSSASVRATTGLTSTISSG